MTTEEDFIYEEDEGPRKEDRVLGAICYMPFGFIVPFIMKKQSEFVSFHTKRGGIIFGLYFLLVILSFFSLLGTLTLAYLWLAGFAGWKAYNGEMFSYGFIDAIVGKM